jgi:hypothetical protein
MAPACKDVIPEEEEGPPLKAVIEQRDWAQSRIVSEVRQWPVEWSLQWSSAGEKGDRWTWKLRSRCQAMSSEDTVDLAELLRAVVNRNVCESAIAL